MMGIMIYFRFLIDFISIFFSCFRCFTFIKSNHLRKHTYGCSSIQGCLIYFSTIYSQNNSIEVVVCIIRPILSKMYNFLEGIFGFSIQMHNEWGQFFIDFRQSFNLFTKPISQLLDCGTTFLDHLNRSSLLIKKLSIWIFNHRTYFALQDRIFILNSVDCLWISSDYLVFFFHFWLEVDQSFIFIC